MLGKPWKINIEKNGDFTSFSTVLKASSDLTDTCFNLVLVTLISLGYPATPDIQDFVQTLKILLATDSLDFSILALLLKSSF